MFLYHVTFYQRIPDIAADGLCPGGPRTIGGRGYDGHARGKVFLTVREGLAFWFNRAVDFAEHYSDDPVEDLYVPVVLRTNLLAPKRLLHVDSHGRLDAHAPAFFTRGTIPPEHIEVWSGRNWQPITSADMEPAEEGAQWHDPADADDVGYWELLDAYAHPPSPFYPR